MFNDEDLIRSWNLCKINHRFKEQTMRKLHQKIDSSNIHFRDKFKKKSEVLLLHSFLQKFPDLNFENLTCESPDFIIQHQNKKIGLELTEVINHLDKKKIESQLNKIFREAELILQKDVKNLQGLYLIEIDENLALEALKNKEILLKNLLYSIKNLKPKGIFLKIKKIKSEGNVFITFNPEMNLFEELCSEKIKQTIEKKNQKYPLYDRSLDECWLIIVSDMSSLASKYQYIENLAILENIASPFHQIYHLDSLFGSMIKIK